MFHPFQIKENKTPIMIPATNVATMPKSTTTCQFLFSGSFFIEPCCIFKFMPQIGQPITSELHHCCWIHTACLYQPASLRCLGNCITICFASLHRARNRRSAHHRPSCPQTPTAQPLRPRAAPSCLLVQPPWPPPESSALPPRCRLHRRLACAATDLPHLCARLSCLRARLRSLHRWLACATAAAKLGLGWFGEREETERK